MNEVVTFVINVLLNIFSQLVEMLRLLVVFLASHVVLARVTSKLFEVVVASLGEINSGLSAHIVTILANKVLLSYYVGQLLFFEEVCLRLLLRVGEDLVQVLDLGVVASELKVVAEFGLNFLLLHEVQVTAVLLEETEGEHSQLSFGHVLQLVPPVERLIDGGFLGLEEKLSFDL